MTVMSMINFSFFSFSCRFGIATNHLPAMQIKKNNSYIYDIVPKLYAYMSGMRSTFIILGVVVKSCFDIE
jgi:hypothetical protein